MPSSDNIPCSFPSCGKNVTKTSGSVSCLFCLKYFHPNCVGVSSDQLTTLSKFKGVLNYICDSCKTEHMDPESRSFREELRVGLADIQEKFDVILSEVKQELSTKFVELKSDIDICNKKIKSLESSTTNKIILLEQKNEILQKRLNRSDILINGFPKYQENINDLIFKICKAVNVNIEPYDINNYYFINHGNTVLVKFNNIIKRDVVMQNYFKSRNLRFIDTDINKRIYLNDHHTPKVGHILYQCRRIHKEEKIIHYKLINSDRPKIRITFKDNSVKIMDFVEFNSFLSINNDVPIVDLVANV